MFKTFREYVMEERRGKAWGRAVAQSSRERAFMSLSQSINKMETARKGLNTKKYITLNRKFDYHMGLLKDVDSSENDHKYVAKAKWLMDNPDIADKDLGTEWFRHAHGKK